MRVLSTPSKPSRFSQYAAIVVGLLCAAAIAGTGLAISMTGGAPNRLPPSAAALGGLDIMWQWDGCRMQAVAELGGGSYCTFGAEWSSAANKGILWGDSHAQHYAPLVERVAIEKGISFALIDTCPAALGDSVYRIWPDVPDYKTECEDRHKIAISALRSGNIPLLVMAGSWNALATLAQTDSLPPSSGVVITGIEETLVEIPQTVRIVLLDQTPMFYVDPAMCAAGAASGLLRAPCIKDLGVAAFNASAELTAEAFPGMDQLAIDHPNLKVLHPREIMCRSGTCMTDIDGEFLYRDSTHLRRNLSGSTKDKLGLMIGLFDAL